MTPVPPTRRKSCIRGDKISWYCCLRDRDRYWTGWLGRQDSNLCVPESELAKTLSLDGGIRTSASENQIRRTRRRSSADLTSSLLERLQEES